MEEKITKKVKYVRMEFYILSLQVGISFFNVGQRKFYAMVTHTRCYYTRKKHRQKHSMVK